MPRLLLALLACSALVAVGCSSEADDPPDSATPTPVEAQNVPAACSPVRAWTPGETRQTMDFGGVPREYILHVPPSYDGTAPMPLVLGFHGIGEGAEHLTSYTRFGAAADEHGFVFVAPQALGVPLAWNQFERPGGADDAGFAEALLDRLELELCLDPDRLFLAGFSNGGGMANLTACRLQERLAAVGIVAGAYIDCEADLPLVAFHGIDDPVVPFEGGVTEQFPTLTFRNVRRVASEWARGVGCDGLAVISKTAPDVELSTFPRCSSGEGTVLLYSILGGGHTWPGTEPLPEAFTGPTTQQIVATDVMWDFFEAHPRD